MPKGSCSSPAAGARSSFQGGENIYPAEVERILGLHPLVVEVAVVGEPDPRWGEMPVAYLVASPGATEAEVEAELLDWCQTQLASFKRPRRWVFRSELPKTALGKVRKHELNPARPGHSGYR